MKTILIIFLALMSCVSKNNQPLYHESESPKISDCGVPLLLIDEGMGSGQIDIDNMKIAEKRCEKIYKNSPCLRVFRVVGKLQYYATCGEKILTKGEANEVIIFTDGGSIVKLREE